MIWLSKIKSYVLGGVAIVVLAALAWLKLRLHLARDRADEAEAERDQAQAENAIHEANEQHASEVQYATTTTEREIDQMADVGRQQVGTAKPGTAAGWLRRNANRDDPDTRD